MNIAPLLPIVLIVPVAYGTYFFRKKIALEPRIPVDNGEDSTPKFRTHEYYVGAFLFFIGWLLSTLIGFSLSATILSLNSLKLPEESLVPKDIPQILTPIIGTVLSIAVGIFFSNLVNIRVKGMCALIAGALLGLLPIIYF